MHKVTRILNAIEGGEAGAAYDELRLRAAQKLSHEGPGNTLQATALVHEAYLRLVDGEGPAWQSRTYFFGAAAEAMRRIPIDNARQKRRLKRGGGRVRMELRLAAKAKRPTGLYGFPASTQRRPGPTYTAVWSTRPGTTIPKVARRNPGNRNCPSIALV